MKRSQLLTSRHRCIVYELMGEYWMLVRALSDLTRLPLVDGSG